MSDEQRIADVIGAHLERSDLEPILFAGAGVSMRAGLPDWKGLLKDLANGIRGASPLMATVMAENIARGKLTKAAEFWGLVDEIPRGERLGRLKSILSAYDAGGLRSLASLPFRACLTTNFDRALLDAFAVARGAAPVDYKLGDRSFSQAVWDRQFYVERVHGCVEDAENIVLSDRQFDALLQNDPYVELLTRAFTNKAVLFLGFSFYDPAIRHVFEVLDKRFGAASLGRHVAIVPRGTNEFLQKAARLNIAVVEYDSAGSHDVLWNAIGDAAKAATRNVKVTAGVTPKLAPLAPTKRYLAACYARAQISSDLTPLSEIVLEGVISAAVQDAAPKALAAHEIGESVRGSIGLRGADITRGIEIALKSLVESGLVRKHKAPGVKGYKFAWAAKTNGGTSLDEAMLALAKHVLDRAYVQEGWRPKDQAVHDVVVAFMENVVQHRGWDLGAAFAANRPPDSVDVPQILFESGGSRLSAFDRERLGRTIDSLFVRPTPEEATILAELGRVSFALELAFQAPRSTLFHRSTLPKKVYLDANVVMPAIIEGHPNQHLYTQAIHRLKDAAAKSGSPCQIIIYYGYLNEITSHRRAALDAAAHAGGEFEAAARSDVLFHGATNVNVFTGAYIRGLETGGTEDFSAFVQRVAPYRLEAELRRYLHDQGFIVVEGVKDPTYVALYSLLERANAKKLVNGKAPILLEHDALQLRLLESDRATGERSLFVTADRRLYDDVSDKAFVHLRDSMISHVGLLQLIDLMVGLNADKRQVGALLWSNTVSDRAQKIRSHLVAEALEQYDAALTMGMHQIVEAHADRIVRELERSRTDLDTQSIRKRVDAFRTLGHLESGFFKNMREAMEKIESERR